MKRAWKNKDGKINLKFSSEHKKEFMVILDFVKSLPNRTFDTKLKIWTVPNNQTVIKKIKEAGFVCEGLEESVSNKWQAFKIDLSKLDGFRDYQKEGVRFLCANNGHALLADDMGIGKTIQALGYLIQNPDIKKVLIICPASVKENWRKELKKWTGRSSVVLSGRSDHIRGDIVVINYDILSDYTDSILDYGFQQIIADESHNIKEPRRIKTKAFCKIAKKVGHVIALTGTPIENRPIEIFTTLEILDPKMWSNRFNFGVRYCNGKNNGFGWVFNGASNMDELHIYISSYMLRRKKSEVLKDLPEKTRSIISIKLSDTDFKKYKELEYTFMSDSVMCMDFLGVYNELTLALFDIKKEIIFSWLDDFLESGKKIVIFAVHKVVISAFMEKYAEKIVKIDGSVDSKNRQSIVDYFQNNEKAQIFIGNIKAAGEGLTLTAADTVLFIELPLTPGRLFQAEDRCHRIGQKNAVTVYYPLVENSIEEFLFNTLTTKESIVNNVIDGLNDDSSSVLKNLFNQYKNIKG